VLGGLAVRGRDAEVKGSSLHPFSLKRGVNPSNILKGRTMMPTTRRTSRRRPKTRGFQPRLKPLSRPRENCPDLEGSLWNRPRTWPRGDCPRRVSQSELRLSPASSSRTSPAGNVRRSDVQRLKRRAGGTGKGGGLDRPGVLIVGAIVSTRAAKIVASRVVRRSGGGRGRRSSERNRRPDRPHEVEVHDKYMQRVLNVRPSLDVDRLEPPPTS
jgi:hypothetical protein